MLWFGLFLGSEAKSAIYLESKTLSISELCEEGEYTLSAIHPWYNVKQLASPMLLEENIQAWIVGITESCAGDIVYFVLTN